jgi:adenylate kinase family enzyme
MTREKVEKRLSEFWTKTLPVIEKYRNMGILTEINAEQSRDQVFAEVVEKIYEFSKK